MLGVSPLLGFAAGYMVLVIASIKGRGALESIAYMIAVYAVLSVSIGGFVGALVDLTSWNDVRTLVYIYMSMTIAGLMKETGLLDSIVKGASAVGRRFSFAAVPAMIGLLPMPGGALVSAVAMKRKYMDEARLNPEWATFINHWFRHVWVPSWPLFQSIVITSSVFRIDPSLLVLHTWPITVLAILAGALVSYPLLRRVNGRGGGSRAGDMVRGAWPFILLAVLVFGFRLSLLYALSLTIVLLVVWTRPSYRACVGALKFASNYKIYVILLEALLFKNLLVESGAPREMMTTFLSRNIYVGLLVYLVPFVLGLSAGGENFFAATAMPLLKDVISAGSAINWDLMLLAYAGGYLGVMASPVHLCIVFTSDYYNAKMATALALVLAAIAVTTALLYAFITLI